MSLVAQLSQFALAPVGQGDAAEASEVMALSLFDWAVCGIAGAEEPVARITREMVSADSAPGPAAVFGGNRCVTPRAAALANGAASHALDYDDTHFDHIGHPSVAVFPAAVALAQDGASLIEAALVGAELSVRLGLWLGRAHYQAGFHQTATAGAFGATAAAGRLLGLTDAQMQAALGLAATRAAGLKSQFGTMGKPYHAGMAASTGAEAALLAQAGFDTRGAGLDGPQGFGPTHHGEADAGAFRDLGARWHMTRVSYKFHACCHGLHAMLEALGSLDPRPDPGEVTAVEVTTHPRWLSVCNIAEPATGLETKFSYRHTAAMALLGRDTAALGSFTDQAAREAGLAEFRQKVTLQADADMAETAARVRVVLASGQARMAQHDLAQPIPIAERAARLRAKARALLGAARADRLWQATAGGAPDLAALATLMADPASVDIPA